MKMTSKKLQNKIIPPSDKFILDPTCGGRMMWDNKQHPNVIYGDIRQRERGHIPQQPNHHIKPDIIMDFRDIPFADNSFKLVVFDPPHIVFKSNIESIMQKKYGSLNENTWKDDIEKGFNECWRVLEPYGILIFKWNTFNYTYSDLMKVIKRRPLFKNVPRKRNDGNKTIWMCFMKIPENGEK